MATQKTLETSTIEGTPPPGSLVSGLRRRLFVLVLVAMVPILGLIIYDAKEEYDEAIFTVWQDAERIVEITSARQMRVIDSARQLLILLAKLPEVRNRSVESCRQLMKGLIERDSAYANLGVIGADGNLWCSALEFSGEVSSIERAYFRRAMTSKDFAIGNYQIGKVTGKGGINFAYPVIDSLGTVHGVVFAALSLDWMTQLAGTTRLPQEATLSIVDSQGVILARFPEPRKWEGQPVPDAPLFQLVQHRQGTAALRGPDGVQRLYAYNILGANPAAGHIYVLVGIRKEAAFAEASWNLVRNLLGLAMACSLALAAAWLTGNRLVVAYVSGQEEAYAQAASAARRTERVLERIRALHEIGEAVTSTLDLQAVLKVLLEKIDRFMPGTAVLVWLINPESGTVERATCWNVDEADWKGRKLSGTPSLVQAAISGRMPVFVRNIQTDMRTLDPQFYRRNGLISYLGLPLVVQTEVLGVLVLLTREEHEFSAEEMEFLTSLAAQAAIAIHNSQLHSQTQTARSQLQISNRKLERLLQEQAALYATLTPLAPADSVNQTLERVIDRLIETTGADAALIRMKDQSTGDFTYVAQRGFPNQFLEDSRAKSAHSAIGHVIETGQPLIASDIAADPRMKTKLQIEAGFRSCVLLPLKVRNEMRGVVLLSSRELGRFVPDQEAHFMAIVHQIGIALENRELFDEVRASKAEVERANEDLKRKEEIQALLKELNQDITRLEIDVLLKKLTEKVREILRVDISDVRVLVDGRWELTGIAGIDPQLLNAARSGTSRGPAGWIQKHRRSLVIPDLTRTDIPTGTTIKSLGVHGYAGVPLFSRSGDVIGVLRALTYEPRNFTQEEMDLLQQIANGTAIAMENARLLDEIKQQALELEKSNAAKDELLEVMARQKEELARLNAGLQREIAERARAEAEVAAKNRDLETLLYVTSHDLREPLRAIENFSRIVADRYGGRLDEKGQDFLRRVVQGGQRLNRLLDDILTLSRSQRMGTPTEEVEGETIVLEALRRLEGKINATNAKITVAKDFDGLRVDKTWATQAVYNLIANALKFTRNGEPPEIEIAAYHPEGPGLKANGVAVRDRGPGVAPEHAERIFQLFQRAVGREVEGTGAGLAIVRQIAERHGGKAWVQPRDGGGSEFIITFHPSTDIEGSVEER